MTSRPVQWQEQLQDTPPRTQFGRALAELDIEWIAAHSPQAKGRIERLFKTLQDRLVKEMRVAEIATLEQANRFLEITFWPQWNQRFAVAAGAAQRCAPKIAARAAAGTNSQRARGAHVASDHTVRWEGQRWGVRREEVCAGLRGAHAEIERRLDGTHWLRFRGRYLPLHPCPDAPRSASPSGLRPPGLADRKPKPPTTDQNQIQSTSRSPLEEDPGSGHFYLAKNRTFLLCVDTQTGSVGWKASSTALITRSPNPRRASSRLSSNSGVTDCLPHGCWID